MPRAAAGWHGGADERALQESFRISASRSAASEKSCQIPNSYWPATDHFARRSKARRNTSAWATVVFLGDRRDIAAVHASMDLAVLDFGF
jgi:hypothetical protein